MPTWLESETSNGPELRRRHAIAKLRARYPKLTPAEARRIINRKRRF